MAKKTKKCRCLRCRRPYKAQAGVRFERSSSGNRFVKVGKSKPICIGLCGPCFDEKIEGWLKEEDV